MAAMVTGYVLCEIHADEDEAFSIQHNITESDGSTITYDNFCSKNQNMTDEEGHGVACEP
jgi:hypothetical protein